MEIIPSISLLDGRCVSLYKGDLAQKTVYSIDPVEYAMKMNREGAEKLHILNMNGIEAHNLRNIEIVQAITQKIPAKIQLAGGIRSMESVKKAFETGASEVIIGVGGHAIFKDAIELYGADKIIIGMKAKENTLVTDSDYTGTLDLIDFAHSLVPLGVKKLFYKDLWSEGTLIHPNYDQVDRLILATHIKVYVSGGISEIKHIKLLKKIGAAGTIIGKAFLERMLNFKTALFAAQTEV